MSDERGFVKVDCARCANPDVWLRCESCKKADHFVIRDATGAEAKVSPRVVACDCNATYAFATCTCGEKVPMDKLRFIRWDRGPKNLADLEIAWDRIAVIVFLVLAVVGGAVWWLSR